MITPAIEIQISIAVDRFIVSLADELAYSNLLGANCNTVEDKAQLLQLIKNRVNVMGVNELEYLQGVRAEKQSNDVLWAMR